MSEHENLLLKLSSAQFALWELHLYLDTHPTSREAMTACEKYKKQYSELKALYEKTYGPLEAPNCKEAEAWLNEPFPWEYKFVSEEDR